MGSAFSAVAAGPDSPYWNPAGLSRANGLSGQTSMQMLALDGWNSDATTPMMVHELWGNLLAVVLGGIVYAMFVAQLTAVIQAHEITTPAAPAAGAGRPMSARRNGNTLGAQIHAVEHLHKSLQRTARVQLANQALAAENQRLRRALFDFDGPRAASPPRTPRAAELGSPRDGLLRPTHPRKRVEHPVPMLPVMGASCGVGSASLMAASSRPATAAGGGVVPPRPARGRAGLSSATRRKNPPAPRGAAAKTGGGERPPSSDEVRRAAAPLLESGWATGSFGSMPSPPA